MITIGTPEFAKAQEIARDLKCFANISRRSSSTFNLAFDKVGRIIEAVKALDCFAAKVAETIDKTMNPYGYQVARISDKQAWIIACAAVENNIEF